MISSGGGFSKQRPDIMVASTAFETTKIDGGASAGGMTKGTITKGTSRPISAYPVNGFTRKSMQYDHSMNQSKGLPVHHSQIKYGNSSTTFKRDSTPGMRSSLASHY